LQHMGTFSRALTAPVACHGLHFGSTGQMKHYHDDGSANLLSVDPTTPLLQTHFSLGRLALVPSPGQTATNPEALQACFGIQATTSVSGSLTATYVGPGGNNSQPIKSLDEIKDEVPPREPNFFELLKAGISAKTGGPAPTDIDIQNTGFSIISKYQANRALFQSEGGLGYAVEFWTGTFDYSALLDLFTATEEPSVATGRINPNLLDNMALYTVLSNSALSETLPSQVSSKALTIAVSLQSTLPYNPLEDHSGWVKALANVSGLSDNEKRAALVALAPVTNTRTWNLLIDVIAQAGVFPKNSGSLAHFTVQSERRLWLHVAIDRYTGKVVDQQLEPVYE